MVYDYVLFADDPPGELIRFLSSFVFHCLLQFIITVFLCHCLFYPQTDRTLSLLPIHANASGRQCPSNLSPCLPLSFPWYLATLCHSPVLGFQWLALSKTNRIKPNYLAWPSRSSIICPQSVYDIPQTPYSSAKPGLSRFLNTPPKRSRAPKKNDWG